MKILATRSMKVAAIALMAAYLMAGSALADELVLCVTEDGRMSVEEAAGISWATSHNTPHRHGPHEGAGSCLSAQRACCGSCLHIPMTSSASQAHQVHWDQGDSQAPLGSACVCDWIDSDLDDYPALSGQSPGVRAAERSALRILRSVVIVI